METRKNLRMADSVTFRKLYILIYKNNNIQ